MDTRQLAFQRVARAREGGGGGCACVLFGGFTSLILLVMYVQQQPSKAAISIVERVRPLQSVGRFPSALSQLPSVALKAVIAAAPATEDVKAVIAATADVTSVKEAALGSGQEHLSSQPMAILNRERARVSGKYATVFKTYKPSAEMHHPGGSLDEKGSLSRGVSGASAESEVMMLCIGGSGSMRAGMNLVFNFRAMGLYNMLILAYDKQACACKPPMRTLASSSARPNAYLPSTSLPCRTPSTPS